MQHKPSPRLVLAVPFVASALAGCPAPSADPVDAGSTGTDAPAGSGPTYTGDVRPILAEHCTGCHVTGGIAPFALDSYSIAQAFGPRIAEVTAARIMPPFLADNSGDCSTYTNARWLEQEELDTLAQWVAVGMPEGDPSIPAPMPGMPPTLSPAEIATTVDIGGEWTPDPALPDTQRCFVVDMTEIGSRLVTGYEVLPGEARVVHHVILYEPTSADAAAEVMALDAADPRLGYDCNGGIGAQTYPVVLWAPGGGAQQFPAGTGVPVGTWPAVIQIHYNTMTAGSLPDHTRIHLSARAGVTPAVISPVADPANLRLPPRMESASQTIEVPIPSNIRVHGIFAHMHQRGVTMQAEILRGGGGTECMTELPRWDFNWQLGYYYSEPFDLTRADRVRLTCTFNTMGESDVVTWGEGTGDEMCLAYFYVTGR